MQIQELTFQQKEPFETFVQKHPLGSIHQTEEWGIFQSQTGKRDRHWIFIAHDSADGNESKILASALVIRQRLPFKKCWLYSPRGPLIDFSDEKSVAAGAQLLQKIKALAKEQNAIFFRFDPAIEKKSAEHEPLEPHKINFQYFFQKFLHAHRARIAHAHYQPEHTLIVNLEQNKEDILKQMKPKGRYNIKVAQKHDVKIRISDNNQQDIDNFYALLTQTTTRDKFSGHPKKYYESMVKIFVGNKLNISNKTNAGNRPNVSEKTLTNTIKPASSVAKLYLAEYQNKVIAGAIVTYFGNTATYYFGASSSEFRNVMAPYLLHWHIMQEAKAAGYHHYDFFGISPENDPRHAWASVTEFKLKFGGRRIEYVPAQEIIYRPFWYFVMKLAKFFQRAKRLIK